MFKLNPVLTCIAGLVLSALPLSMTFANGEGILVDQFHETPLALQFRRVEHPEATYYIPRTHTEVKCEKLSQSAVLWTCTVSLVRSGVAPADLGQNAVFYPFTPSTECALLSNLEDTRIVAALKIAAQIRIRAQGITPSGDSGTVCSFSLVMRGESSQVAELSQLLTRQAEAGTLVESPIIVDLIEAVSVSEPMQASLAKDIGLDPMQTLTRGEASFLLGVASGRVSQVSDTLVKLSGQDRASFYKRAFASFFVESASGFRLQPQPLSRMSVYLEKAHSFNL